MKLSKEYYPLYGLYALLIMANVFIFYFTYVQITGTKALNDYWLNETKKDLIYASHLAEVESNLGYVGFIHNFKNYVIRRTDEYYDKTVDSYEKTKSALESLKYSNENKEYLELIKSIESTLDEYYSKLMLAKEKDKHYLTPEIDQLVKVDDTTAEKSLRRLRDKIVSNQNNQLDTTNNMVIDSNHLSISMGTILIPFFLFLTIFISKLFIDLINRKRELMVIFDSTPSAIILMERSGKILKANSAATEIFGYTTSELESLNLEQLVPKHFREEHKKLRQDFMKHEQSRIMGARSVEIVGIHKDSSELLLNITIVSKVIDGEMKSFCVIKDMTVHTQLKNHAEKDHLTSIYNRRYFDSILNEHVQLAYKNKTALSLFMIDLDNFKNINDNYGHAAGDNAIKEIAEFLVGNTREIDYVARWGGDEFVLLCPGLSGEDAIKQAKRLHQRFNSLIFPWQPKLTLSIGIASSEKGTVMAENSLLEAADKALYFAKSNGRNQIQHYLDTMP